MYLSTTIGIDSLFIIQLCLLIMINIKDNRCDFCGVCITVGPPDCIDIRESSIKIHHQECIDCDLCIDICPIEVLSSDAS